MLVRVDVVVDLLSRLVQRLPRRAPGQTLFELAEPGLDERLRLGIAVATPPVGDPTGRQVPAKVAGGELAAIEFLTGVKSGWMS